MGSMRPSLADVHKVKALTGQWAMEIAILMKIKGMEGYWSEQSKRTVKVTAGYAVPPARVNRRGVMQRRSGEMPAGCQDGPVRVNERGLIHRPTLFLLSAALAVHIALALVRLFWSKNEPRPTWTLEA